MVVDVGEGLGDRSVVASELLRPCVACSDLGLLYSKEFIKKAPL